MFAVAQRWPSMHTPVAGPDEWWFAVVGSFDDLCPDLRPQWWRLWSYQLVHAGWVHVVGNLSVQLLFGIPVNMVKSHLNNACVSHVSFDRCTCPCSQSMYDLFLHATPLPARLFQLLDWQTNTSYVS